MATPKKPAPGKKVFTATVTTEKQQRINTRTGTANMRDKAKPEPAKVNKKGLPLASQLNAKMQKAPVKKQGGPAPKKPSASINKAVPGNKGIAKGVEKRVKNTVREAKDIVGAVKAVGKAAGSVVRGGDTFALKNVAKNLPRQVGEVARAAVTGKSGTTPSKVYTGSQSHRKKGATNSVPQQRGR